MINQPKIKEEILKMIIKIKNKKILFNGMAKERLFSKK